MDAISITAGFILDLVLGDPYNFPHPVRYIGKLIEKLETALGKINNKKMAGILLTLTVVLFVYLVTYYIASISPVINILLIYTVFASKSLATEAKKVYISLNNKNINKAREQISLLVSRDTENMDEESVIKSTIETVSENIVDGIISPMFYLLIGGISLAMAYKAVNTLDSMVGYKNEKYIDLGWASARLDDLLNYIPARITAFILIPIAALINGMSVKNTFKITMRDKNKHSSPNSAYSEAAAAGALGCELGGPASYFGKVEDKPFIGDKLKEIDKEDIIKSIRLMYSTSVAGLAIGLFVRFIII